MQSSDTSPEAGNMQARFRFAQDDVHWTTEQWRYVVYSDEPAFNLFKNGELTHVKRRTEATIHKMFVILPVKQGGGIIMVQECF